MRASLVTVALSAVALMMVACGPGLNAPKLSDGSKIGIYVVQDRNLPMDAEAEKLAQRTQMSEFFETDLNSLLTKYGYEVFPIASAEEFNPAPNKFLLSVRVLSYNAGSKGARVAGALMGGFAGNAVSRAGAANLAAEFSLKGEQGKVAGTDVNISSTDYKWQNLCRQVNMAIIKGTSKSLQKLYK